MALMDRKTSGNANKIAGLMVTAFLFALYITFPYVGAVSAWKLLVRFICSFISSAVVCLLLYKGLGLVLPCMHCKKIEAVIYGRWSDRIFFLTVWGILVISWLPAYLAFFPGIFGYDAPNQMQQILTGQYTSHHPLLHTLVLEAFLNCGKAVFGTYNGGVLLFCIVQGLVLGGSIAYSMLIMKQLKIPFWIMSASLVWCMWNPVLQVLAFNTTKDILFGAVFLHFVINCYRWLVRRERRTVCKLVCLVVSGILMCLLRNQGIYIVAVLLPVSVLLCRKEHGFWLSLCVILIGSQSFFWVSDHALGVQKGDARELLSVPMQQTALVCKLYMEGEEVRLTPDEFEKFSLLVAPEHISELNVHIADPIKTYFDTAALRQDISGYVSLYLTVGAHNIGPYLIAFRDLAYPYWDASKMNARELCMMNTFPELSESWGIRQNSLLPGYKEYLSAYILCGMDRKIPVLSVFLQPGVCIWIMTALLGVAIARKNRTVLVPALTGMLFMGTLLLGPAALLRYIYPLMILTPWYLAVLCGEI